MEESISEFVKSVMHDLEPFLEDGSPVRFQMHVSDVWKSHNDFLGYGVKFRADEETPRIDFTVICHKTTQQEC